MCAVSMIYDYYRQPVPDPFPVKPIPWLAGLPPELPWTREAFEDLKKILARLDELDQKLGLANCEDPKKGAWMQAIEDRLRRLEEQAVERG